MKPSAIATSTASHTAQPFVLTVTLDASTQTALNALRKAHFPPHRNFLDAHLTLFHALPATALPTLKADLEHLCGFVAPYEVGVGPVFAMGNRGVGVNVGAGRKKAGGRTQGLHEKLLKRWSGEGLELSNQDRQGLTRPHVTVQNKVTEEEAQKTLELVKRDWRDFTGTATGFALWEYQRNGTWKHEQDFHFKGEPVEAPSPTPVPQTDRRPEGERRRVPGMPIPGSAR